MHLRISDMEAGVAALDASITEAGLEHKAVAADLGKPYASWMGERNPFQDTHKLGLWTVISVLFITRRPGPFLRWLCGLFNFVAVPGWASHPAATDLKSEMLKAGKAMGDLGAEIVSATDPKGEAGEKISGPELERLYGRAMDVCDSVTRTLGGAQMNTVRPEGERRKFN